MDEFDLKIGVRYVHYKSRKTVLIMSFGLVQIDDVWHPSVNYNIIAAPASPENVANGIDCMTMFTRTRAEFAARFVALEDTKPILENVCQCPEYSGCYAETKIKCNTCKKEVKTVRIKETLTAAFTLTHGMPIGKDERGLPKFRLPQERPLDTIHDVVLNMNLDHIVRILDICPLCKTEELIDSVCLKCTDHLCKR